MEAEKILLPRETWQAEKSPRRLITKNLTRHETHASIIEAWRWQKALGGRGLHWCWAW